MMAYAEEEVCEIDVSFGISIGGPGGHRQMMNIANMGVCKT